MFTFSSASITNSTILYSNFLLTFLIESFSLANVGIRFSVLHTLINDISASVEGSNKFVNVIKQQVIPSSYKLVSFDVKCLFTNKTIDIILKRIYDKHEITTHTGRKEMKELINLCAKKCPDYF